MKSLNQIIGKAWKRVKWLQNWGRGRTMGVAILLTSCSPSVTHQTSGGSSDTVHICIGFSLARQL